MCKEMDGDKGKLDADRPRLADKPIHPNRFTAKSRESSIISDTRELYSISWTPHSPILISTLK